MPLTTEAVLAMQPGSKLNNAVHSLALGRAGKSRPYSTNLAEAASILEQLPIFAARVSTRVEGYDENKPFIAGTMEWVPGLKTYCAVDRVKCATIQIAICKAALLYTIKPKEAPVVARPMAVPPLGTMPPATVLEPMPQRIMAAKLPELPAPPPQQPGT